MIRGVKKATKIISVFILLFFLFFLSWFILSFTLNSSLNYNLYKLRKKGLLAESKGFQLDVLDKEFREVDIKEKQKIINIVIEYIDDYRPSKVWYKETVPYSLACRSSSILKRFSGKEIGSLKLCKEDYMREWIRISNKWKDWYKNEYPNWIKKQEKLNNKISVK